jgi:hypothetical protein
MYNRRETIFVISGIIAAMVISIFSIYRAVRWLRPVWRSHPDYRRHPSETE